MVTNLPNPGTKLVPGKFYYRLGVHRGLATRMYSDGWRVLEVTLFRFPTRVPEAMVFKKIISIKFAFWLPFEIVH